ncbi:hypothetical protein ES703_70580 [subsurface metagenome]
MKIKSATKVVVSAFGILLGLAGIEHGIGEIFQGNIGPNRIVIKSWGESELFSVLEGEPAMTIIPNLLITGVLAIIVSLSIMLWAVAFVQRKNGGLVLILLSILLLLVGGGFGPPLIGIIVGAAGTRINAPLPWWRKRLSVNTRRLLSKLWPWSLIASLLSYLYLFPVSIILWHLFGVYNPNIILGVPLFAFGTLLLAVFSGFARDIDHSDRNAVT